MRLFHLSLGCEKLTDTSLKYLTQNYSLVNSTVLIETVKYLDISFCPHINGRSILNILEYCKALDHLDVSGICNVNDDFVHQLCLKRPSIQKLSVQRCVLLTDLALCSLADYLWIEELNINGCNKVRTV
jgi:hypothetical protein